MPTYEFRCPDGHDFEKFYRTISGAESTAACPVCGKPAERVMSPTGFAFKGSGFYLTDYGKNAHREKGTSDGKGSSSGEGSAGDSGGAVKDAKSATGGDAATSTANSTPAGESKPSAAKADAKPAPAPAKKSAGE